MNWLIRKHSKAFGLLEVLLAAMIVVTMFLISFELLRSGMRLSSRSAAQGLVQEEARHMVETIARELKDTGEASTGWEVGVNPDPADEYYEKEVSRISFSRCVGYDSDLEMLLWGQAVTYEFEPPVGPEPGKIVRTQNGNSVLVCNHVTEFAVTYYSGASLVQIRVTLQTEDPESPGHFIRASYTTSKKLRN